MERIEADIESGAPTIAEVVRAADVFGKYGLGEAKVITAQEMIDAVTEAILECDWMTSEQGDELARRVEAHLKSF